MILQYARRNAVAFLALFVALGGTGAYAANEWNGSNVQDETLTGADVRGKAATSTAPAVQGTLTGEDVRDTTLTWRDLAPETLGSTRILDNSLTGADIDESRLGPVPGAAAKILFDEEADFEDRVGTVTVGSWTLTMTCHYEMSGNPGDGLIERAVLSVNASGPGEMQWSGSDWRDDSETVEDPVTPRMGAGTLGEAPGSPIAQAAATVDGETGASRSPARVNRTAYLRSASQVAQVQFIASARLSGSGGRCQVYGQTIHMG